MKKKSLKRGFTSVLVIGAVGSTSLGFVSIPYVGMTPTIAHATSSTGPAIADETSQRSIVIHKYTDLLDAIEVGKRDDGKPTTIDPAKHTPIGGATFELIHLVPPNGKFSPKIPTVNADGSLNKGDYVERSGKINATTKADGSVEIVLGTTTVSDGYYYVRETTTASTELTINGKTTTRDQLAISTNVKPFVIEMPQTEYGKRDTLMYKVNVYPKNEVTDFNPLKTIEGGQNHSIIAGYEYKWQMNDVVPADLVRNKDDDGKALEGGKEIYADYFRFIDQVSPEQYIKGVLFANTTDDQVASAVKGYGLVGTKKINLVSKTDYVARHSTKDKNVLVIDLTKAGMKKLSDGKATNVEFEVTMHVADNFNGIISNDFWTTYKTPSIPGIQVPNIPGIPPTVPKDPELPGEVPEDHEPDGPNNPDTPGTVTPNVYTGGFDIYKTRSDTGAPLAGSVFKVANTEKDARDHKFLKYANGQDITATSDNKGRAFFHGLKLEVDGATSLADIEKSYWVVEVQAPDGYSLLKEPKEVIVTLSTADASSVELNVANNPKTNLPFTGGNGITYFVVTGMTLVGAAGVFYYKKKKSTKAEVESK